MSGFERDVFDQNAADRAETVTAHQPVPGGERNRVVGGVSGQIADHSVGRRSIDVYAVGGVVETDPFGPETSRVGDLAAEAVDVAQRDAGHG